MAQEEGSSKTYYITTPIYYVNALPHIGHSYTTVAADVVARYQRLRGLRVLFATGTDEHGQKVYRSALERGRQPQEFVDEIAAAYQEAWRQFHIEYDVFIRTTDPRHVRVVRDVFSKLAASGDIYPGTYEGWYCVACESYYREDELEAGRCPDCGRPVEKVAERAYFFRTSKYADALLGHIDSNPEFILPEQRRNEVIAFIERGLLDACISRQRSEWDIPVPGDESQSIYVWFDALINYLTVAGYLQDDETFARTWPPDLQLMGKDILPRFHATIWPAMLMALGLELPRTLFAHGWWMTAARDRSGLAKMSKSLGNVVDPLASARALAEASNATEEIAIDAIRYYLLREVTFGLDGVFSMDNVLERFNADLANDLGNLLNRSLPLVVRGLQRRTPSPGPGAGALGDLTRSVRDRYEAAMQVCDFRRALETLWELVRAANKYVDDRQPWNRLREGKTEEASAALYDVLDAARVAAIGIWPVMPSAAEEIWRQLGLAEAGVEMKWDDFEAGRLPSGVTVHKPKPIFPRIDIQRVRQQALSPQARAAAPQEELIDIGHFEKLDLRVGKVLAAEPVPGADKLLRLIVDVGEEEPRQVVAGLAPVFSADDLIGQNVVVVANLEPASIRGVQSQGMILAAGDKKPLALVVVQPECPPGTKVR